MRILADENVHKDIILGLRRAGYEVLSIPDVGLVAHKDHEILEYSEKKSLILTDIQEVFIIVESFFNIKRRMGYAHQDFSRSLP